MPVDGSEGLEEHQQWKLPCSLLVQMSGQTQFADGRAASSLWCLRTAHLRRWVLWYPALYTRSLSLCWAPCPFTAGACAEQAGCCRDHVWAHANLLRLSKGLVPLSISGCFWRGVDVFCRHACIADSVSGWAFCLAAHKTWGAGFVPDVIYKTFVEALQSWIWYVLSCVSFQTKTVVAGWAIFSKTRFTF